MVLFGAAWPVTRLAFLHGANPAWFGAGRAALSAASAMALLAVMRRLRLPRRGDLPALLAVGLLQIAGFFALAHEGAARVPAGRTAVLANATTIWMPLVSLLILRESIPRRHWLAAAIGLAGVFVLAAPSLRDAANAPALLGDLFLLAAALSFTLAIALVRRFPPRSTMIELLPWCFSLGSALLLPYALLRAPSGGIAGDRTAWAALLAIGGVAGPLGTWCVMRASALLPPMVASVGFLGAPAVGLLLATVWLGETLTPSLLCGFLLILGGILVAVGPARARP